MRSIHSLMDLRGRRALITGGAGHIALAVGEALIELGAKISIVDVDPAACEKRARLLNGRKAGSALPFSCDLMNDAATRETTREAIRRMKGLDILVHTAAYVGTTKSPGWAVPLPRQTPEAFNNALQISLTSAFVMIQEAREALQKSSRGSAIFIGSTQGIVAPDFSLYEGTAMANPIGYGASKGGLIQMARYFAVQLAPRVRVNVLSPGGVFRGQPKIFVDRYVKRTPLKRMAVEEDFKGAVAFLAGDLSAYVTGQNIVVDGGWTVW